MNSPILRTILASQLVYWLVTPTLYSLGVNLAVATLVGGVCSVLGGLAFVNWMENR